MTEYDALVLAGGRATRLGGVDKPGLPVGGTPLLDRVLVAVGGAVRRIVVGPTHAPGADVVTQEDPPGGGPVAGIAAGLAHVGSPAVVVLAADLPFLTPGTVDRLLAALGPGVDATMLLDGDGREQLLLSAWRTAVLRDRITALGEPAGRSVKGLFEGVAIVRVVAALDEGQPPPWLDCDTEDDLRRAREWA